LNNLKKTFRDLCRPHTILRGVKKTGINGEDIEVCCSKSTKEEIEEFSKVLSIVSSDETKFIESFNGCLEKLKKRQEDSEKKKVDEKKRRKRKEERWRMVC